MKENGSGYRKRFSLSSNGFLVTVSILVAAVGMAGAFALSHGAGFKRSFLVRREDQTPIPVTIIEKSNQFIISRVGEDFFKNISLDRSKTEHYEADGYCVKNPDSCSDYLRKPYYLMVYSLKIPNKPFIDELIEFVVDDNGDVINEREASGIPNCIKSPIECDFPIDEERALFIAQEAGLEKGSESWKADFCWGDETYVWNVQNILPEKKQGSVFAGGKSVVIDANTGQAITVGEWSAIW